MEEGPRDLETPPELVLLLDHLQDSPVTANEIASWTKKDPVLSTVLRYVHLGWPATITDPKLTVFVSRRSELSVLNDCLLWGDRVFIPEGGRPVILEELHLGHPGISRMKALARMYVWWPGLDAEVKKLVRQCVACQSEQSSPPPVPLSPWQWPSRPWSRLHLDFAGLFESHMFLVVG